MSEIKEELDEDVLHRRIIAPQKSRESLWGALLFAAMIVFVVASIGGIGWTAYSHWKKVRTNGNNPSITGLLKETEQEMSGVASNEILPPLENEIAKNAKIANEEIISAAKKLEVSVLNGGAAKGSAGVLADFLKKEGYLKTDMGNTQKDYMGVTIYHTVGLEKEVEVIKESVVKKYPQAKILPADSRNKETSVSQVTVILGK